MNRETLQSDLQKTYRREDWLKILRAVLPASDLFAHPQNIATTDSHAESIQHLGKARLQDGRQLAILEVRVSGNVDLPRNRVGLRNVVARFIDQAEYHGVLATFISELADYRFTFAAKESLFDADGNLAKRETAARRFTYLLGPNESCRTAAERFAQLSLKGSEANLADVIEAFSIEKLNNEFFSDFCKAFEKVSHDINSRHPKWPIDLVQHESQTLLNRLLFLYFVQRKGWLNQQRDYLSRHFKAHCHRPSGTSYYDQFLFPVFRILSTEWKQREVPTGNISESDPRHHDLPFLNGGLFSDELGAEQRDENSRRRSELRVSNETFQYVFENLLDIYNFTVHEDTPHSRDVAIDPEMLGRIFESLVLQIEQSATSGTTSRHNTGSYYTPRPVVHYLCREGLLGSLQQIVPSNESATADAPEPWTERLAKIFSLDTSEGLSTDDISTLESCLTPTEGRLLLDHLDELRACDPAVGSGAFPVGLLHELINLARLSETRAGGLDPVVGDRDWLYERKKRYIGRVIYGVDLQERAVEICKLRLWLSLMVDHDLGVDPEKCELKSFRKALQKLEPLPNLDFKIRRADSLKDQIHGQPVDLGKLGKETSARPVLNQLLAAKRDFFSAQTLKDKRKLRFDIYAGTAELARIELTRARTDAAGFGFALDEASAHRLLELDSGIKEMSKVLARIEAARKSGVSAQQKDEALDNLEIYFNDPARPTFVWQLDFAEVFHRDSSRQVAVPSPAGAGEGGRRPDEGRPGKTKSSDLPLNTQPSTLNSTSGFDLIIGNPPYVRQEQIKEQKPYFKEHYDCFTGTADLYVYFYERSIKLLRPGGMFAFITSNKWYRAAYGEKLRNWLAKNSRIHQLIDFGDAPVFTAIAYPTIIILERLPGELRPIDEKEKGKPVEQNIRVLNWQPGPKIERFAQIFLNQSFDLPQSSLKSDGWRLEGRATSKLMERIQKAGKNLGDYVRGRYYYGIKTGFNEAFVIDHATRDALIKEHSSSNEIIKPFLRGRDVKRWKVESKDLWLIFTRRGISIEKYPAILNHLKPFKKGLMPGGEGGRKPGSYEWYEIQDNIAYWEEFAKPKIVVPAITDTVNYAPDSSGFFSNDKTSICIPPSVPFVLAILNSQVSFWFSRQTFASKQGGFYEFKPMYVSKVPIPNAGTNQQVLCERLSEYLIWLNTPEVVRKSGGSSPTSLMTAYFEQWLNGLVYELFFESELHARSIRLFEETAKLNLPALDALPDGQKLPRLTEIFDKAYDLSSPLRSMLFSLGSLETIRIIEDEQQTKQEATV